MVQPLRVLLIEDDPMVVEVNQSFINMIPGFQVIGALRQGSRAVEEIRYLHPDLVILDIYLPDTNGIQVIQQIRSAALPVDVIAITAAQDSETVQQMLRFGVVDYLIKPFKFERLKQALETYLERRKQLISKEQVDQKDIDQLAVPVIVQEKLKHTELPKGLNLFTLEQVLTCLRQKAIPLTAEEVAELVGVARVTARRYLEYLEKEELIQKEIQYGSVGRPVHRYFLR
ncbi:two-component system, CitB family, response regulator DctR [Carboxydocella thermautotrophica]|nr:two-component system, CitB family, response regulator DctR [Carboxydocella thermautotrophica]